MNYSIWIPIIDKDSIIFFHFDVNKTEIPTDPSQLHQLTFIQLNAAHLLLQLGVSGSFIGGLGGGAAEPEASFVVTDRSRNKWSRI